MIKNSISYLFLTANKKYIFSDIYLKYKMEIFSKNENDIKETIDAYDFNKKYLNYAKKTILHKLIDNNITIKKYFNTETKNFLNKLIDFFFNQDGTKYIGDIIPIIHLIEKNKTSLIQNLILSDDEKNLEHISNDLIYILDKYEKNITGKINNFLEDAKNFEIKILNKFTRETSTNLLHKHFINNCLATTNTIEIKDFAYSTISESLTFLEKIKCISKNRTKETKQINIYFYKPILDLFS